MDISTSNWFEYLNENIRLTEGLRDIGLPEFVVDFIENAMPKAPEKAKVYAGNGWKSAITVGVLSPLQFTLVNYLIDQYGKYVIADKLSREGYPTDVAARTVAPYDVHGREDSPPEERGMYDDEQIKRAIQSSSLFKTSRMCSPSRWAHGARHS